MDTYRNDLYNSCKKSENKFFAPKHNTGSKIKVKHKRCVSSMKDLRSNLKQTRSSQKNNEFNSDQTNGLNREYAHKLDHKHLLAAKERITI